MAKGTNRFGFFKNKSRAGITEPFTGYPTWPTVPSLDTYTNFSNNSTKTANITLSRDDSGTIANASFNTGNSLVISDSSGNVTILDWAGAEGSITQLPAYRYDYITGNVTTRTINYTDPLGGVGAGPGNDYSGYAWDDNGNVHLIPRQTRATTYYDEIVFEYDTVNDSMLGFYVGPAGTPAQNWGFSDFLGADGFCILPDKTVFCANKKNYQGGGSPQRTDQKYQIYNPNTKQQSNSAISYPNDQIASGNISNDTSSLVVTNVNTSANVFFLPGLGCYKGSYGVAQANNNTSVIFEANVSTGALTEHEPANLTTAFDRTGFGSGQIETIFSSAVYGADLKIYAFPGSSDLNNSSNNAQGIMVIDPDDVANAVLNTFSIWDVATDGRAHLSTTGFLGVDGFVHWQMGLDDGTYLCSLDTNPTSATYQTGFKQKISIIDTYNVTSYTGNVTSASGFDEIVIDTTVDLSASSGLLTKVVGQGTTNPDLTGFNGATWYLQKISTNTYNLRNSPSSSSGSLLQSGLSGEDPAGLQFVRTTDDPTSALTLGRTRAPGFTANGKVIMAPTYTTEVNPNFANNPINVFNVNGTGFWKTQYAPWNRNNFDSAQTDD